MENQWIENLRRRFADRQQSAPDGLWNSIETAMTERENSGTGIGGETKRKYNRAALTLKICTTAAAACALWLAGLYITNKTAVRTGANHTDDIDHTAQTIQTSGSSAETDAQTIQLKQHTTPYRAENNIAVAAAVQTDHLPYKQASNEQDDATDQLSTPVKEAERHISEKKRKEPGNNKSGRLDNTGRSSDDRPLIAYSAKKNSRHGISFGIYGSNMMYANNGSGSYNSTEMYADAMPQPQFSSTVFSAAATESGKASTAAADSYVKVKHRQPVKFGVAVRFNLTGRLAVGTGLNYSYLSSAISVGSDYSGSDTEQKLHYVGVPLNLICDIWRSGNLNVYVMGGGAADICVGGKSRTWQKTDNTVVSTSEGNLCEHRPQLSVNAAAGVEYNINKHIGIYAEPGVGYYFNNHSGVVTVYKDKPLCFNLSVGLRFTAK